MKEGWVPADATQMHQLLMNLCNNAWQAMKDGAGVMRVGLDETELSADAAHFHPGLKAGPYLRLEVGDAGCGIPPEIRERIFEPYFSTKRRSNGTGLGLAVVQGIVKAHGGSSRSRARRVPGRPSECFCRSCDPRRGRHRLSLKHSWPKDASGFSMSMTSRRLLA